MWYNDYVGIPFLAKGRDRQGLDCWGLVRLIYSEQFNVQLPSLAEDYDEDDVSRIADLAAQYKEGWESTTDPKPGSVILFKVLGHVSHVGVYVGSNKFIHCRENHSVVIEDLNNLTWSRRVDGFFNYVEKSSAVMNVVPHPLRTERWCVPVPAGTSVGELKSWVVDRFQVSREIESTVTIIINGKVVPQEDYLTTIVQDTDVVEYRCVAGKSFFRILLTIAVVVAAAYGGGTLGGVLASGLTTGAQAAVGAAVISTVGNLLIGYLMPVRPPESKNPGSATAQMLLNGGSNNANRYGAIPVVLGKMRMTAVLGAENYVDSDTDNSYLNMLLVWGFGPLTVSNMRIGLNDIDMYESGAGLPVQRCTLNTAYYPPGTDYNDYTTFNKIYGSDRFQSYQGITLVCHTLPSNVNVDYTDGFGSAGPWTEVSLPQTNTSRIDVNFHFPQGLRRLRAQGSSAGDIFEKECKFGLQLRTVDSLGNYGAWGSAFTVSVEASKVVVDQAYLSGVAKYRWYRIGVGPGGIVVKPGPWCDTPTSPYGTLDTASYAKYAVPTLTPRLPSYARDEYPIVDVCMFGSTLYSTDSTVKSTALSGFGITTAFVPTTTFSPATWSSPTVTGTSRGDYLVTIATGTYSVSGTYSYSLGTSASGLFIKRKDAFSYTVTIPTAALPVGSYYQIRARRLNDDSTDPDNGRNQDMHAIVLQTVTATANNRPIIEKTGWNLTRTALRLKANDQLNGRVEGVNAIVQTIAKVWDGTNWVHQPTSNPASLFLYMLEHPANAYRILPADLNSKVKMADIQTWWTFCNTNGFEYNNVVADQRSVLEILRDICAAGRASPAMVDGMWTVVIDNQKTTVVQHFTPHNSWGFESVKRLPRQPDGLKVTYYNRDKDWQQDEIRIYNTGKTSTTAEVFEEISLPGITSYDLCSKLARWHLAQATLRPEIYTINTDLEYLVCNRGDRVKVLHDVPMWGTASGRIKKVVTDVSPTSITRVGSVATATFADQTYQPYAVGTTITITGSSVAGYNGTKTVTGGSSTTVTWADAVTTGTGTGATITTTTPTVYDLDESIPLLASTSYTLRVRNKTGGSTVRTVSTVAAQGYYTRIQLTATSTLAEIDVNDLFMFGTLNTESQDLLVLAIEPYGYQNAKITLVDYAEALFTLNYADNNFTVPTYNSLITLPVKNLIQSITYKPNITSIISNESVMEQIAPGAFKVNVKVGFNNPVNLPSNISTVQLQVDNDGDQIENWQQAVSVPAKLQSITISGVDESSVYKVRLRYCSDDGRTGPWQTAIYASVASAGWNSNVLTITTVSAHSYSVGTPVYLYNNNSSDTSLNNIYVVDTIPSRTSITCKLLQTVNAITTTATTALAGTVVAAYSNKGYTPYLVGEQILVTGASPTAYNGTNVVMDCTSTAVSWANGNLLTWTEDLRNSAEAAGHTAWSEFIDAETVVTNETTIINSVGVAGVSKVQVANTIVGITAPTNYQRQVNQTFSVPDNTIVTCSIEGKAAQLSFLRLYVATKIPDFPSVEFNLLTGTVSSVSNASSSIIQNYGIINLGNGWYRCWVSASVGAGATSPGIVAQIPFYTIGATATAGEGVYMTRAQVNLGPYPSQYVPVLTATPNTLPTASVTGTITPTVVTSSITQTMGEITAKYTPQRYLSFAPGSTFTISNAIPAGFNGTYVVSSSTGNSVTWTNNLIVAPSDYTNGAWIKNNVTTTPITSLVAAPDGSFTASKLAETAITGQHYLQQTVTSTTESLYTLVVYAKAAEWTTFGLQIGGTGAASANFDLTAVTATAVGFTNAATITAVGGGWFKCAVTSTCIGINNYFIYKNNTSYLGTVGTGMYVWNIQLLKNITPNLLSFSTQFDNAAWAVFAPMTKSATNTVVAPDTTTTADTFSTTNAGSFYQDVAAWGRGTYEASIYVSTASTCTDANFVLYYFTGGTTENVTIRFNPSTGALISTTNTIATLVTASIVNVVGVWWKVRIVGTGTSSLNTFCRVQLYSNVVTANTLIVWSGQLLDYTNSATTQGNLVRTPNVGTWTTSLASQANQDVVTGQGLASSKYNIYGNFLAENLLHKVIGKTSNPEQVSNFVLVPDYNGGKLNLSWSANTEIDIQYYEVRTDNVNWGSESGRLYLGSSPSVSILPGALGTAVTYYIKAVDYSKNYSLNAASVTNTVTAPNAVTAFTSTAYNSTSLTDTNVTLTWATAPVSSYVAPNSTFATAKYRVTLTKPIGTPSGTTLTQDVVGTSWVTPANWVGNATLNIVTVDVLGNTSSPSAGFTITKAVPPNVTTVNAPTAVGTGIQVSWTELSTGTNGVPILGYEIRTSNANWGSVSVSPIYSGSGNSAVIDLKSVSSTPGTVKTYYIKAYDVDGQYSSVATSFTYTIAAPTDTTWATVPAVFGDSSLTNATLTLNWNPATPTFGLYGYELSYTTTGGVPVTKTLNTTSITLNTGAVWTTVGTGTVIFTIKVIDNISTGNKSTGVTTSVSKVGPSAVSNFTSKVIDNNVLLSWTVPAKTTLPIDHITVYKGSAFLGATNIGDKTGSFTSILEQTGGNYTYWIVAVDTDGQVSSPISLTATVSQPPDYIFNAAYSSIFANVNTVVTNTIYNTANIVVGNSTGLLAGMQIILSGTAFGGLTAGYYYVVGVLDINTITISTSSALTPIFTATSTASGSMTLTDATGAEGAYVNSIYDTNGIVMPVDTTATVTTHFASGTGRTWTGPSDQVPYYPYFLQPGTSTGYYEEVYNYTKPLTSSQITMNYAGTNISGTPLITTTISTASAVAVGTTSTNTANSTTVSNTGAGSGNLVAGNFITIPAGTGQTVRIVSTSAGVSMVVTPAVVAANSGASTAAVGAWTNYGGTSALGTAFQYVKAKVAVSQATLGTGTPGTVSAPGGAATTTVTVTGASTLFTKVFKVGDTITIPLSGGIDYPISSITSDTVLAVTVPTGVTMPVISAGTAWGFRGLDLYKLTALGVKLDAKQRTESGMIIDPGSATAPNGAIVNFVNNIFIDVASINLTPQGTTVPLSCIYNFIDTNIIGTYNVPGSTVCTITTTSPATHGLIAGQSVTVTFTSGSATSLTTTILTTPASNSFTIAVPTQTSSGSVSIYPNSMTVYAFTSAGTRATTSPSISWTVRGF